MGAHGCHADASTVARPLTDALEAAAVGRDGDGDKDGDGDALPACELLASRMVVSRVVSRMRYEVK